MLLSQISVFLVSCIGVIILTPPTIFFAKKLGLVDDPKTHKHPAVIHKKTLPRGGGLPIYLSILLGILFLLPDSTVFLPVLISGGLIVIVGLLDDRYDLSPYLRFGANIVCAAIVVFSGIHVPFITNPLGGILHFSNISYPIFGFDLSLGSLIAVVWVVWIMNMLNWSKGVDGQMPGIAAISAIVVGFAALRFPVLTESNILISQAAFIVAGASAGFLFYNFYPAKIFPGYSATILGFMIGVLSIMSGVKLATALLVMGVPAADFVFIFIRRIMQHKSPFRGDREHLHHLLLKLGMGQRRIAISYWIVSLLLGVFALNLSSRGKLFAIILVVVVVGSVILTLRFLLRKINEESI
ncbi:MAG TPA: MraY family glycosyltransferase [Patescibacteria group bacterium]|nr:MraY family glycosyltransferase [Patescibacteria group bacterium]